MATRSFRPLLLILVSAITVAVAGRFAMIGADPLHDGIMLKPAIDVAQGKTLFSESFTQYGALTTLIQSVFVKVLGERLTSIRIATIAAMAVYAVFFWLVWSRLVKPYVATLAWFSALGVAYFYRRSFMPWSSEFALCFEAIGAYCFFRYLEKDQKVALGAAGFTAGLAFWCKQSSGPFMALGLAAALVLIAFNRRSGWRPAVLGIIVLSAGFWGSFVPFLVWLTASGALLDWYRQSILFALHFVGSGGTGVFTPENIRLRLLFAPLPWNMLPLFCAGVGLVSLRKVWRGVHLDCVEEKAAALAFMSLPLLTQYYPVPDHHHFFWAGLPAFGILFYGLTRMFRRKLTITVAFVAIFASAFQDSWRKGSALLAQSYYSSDSLGVVSGMQLNKGDLELYRSAKRIFDRYTSAYPDMRLLNATPDPMWTMFAPAEPFHQVYVYWPPVAETIYPEYLPRLNALIAQQKHMLLSFDGPPAGYDGYTKVTTLDNGAYTLQLYVPTAQVLP